MVGNASDRLEERLTALPGIARLREAAAGARAYLVGGVVRDLLLGRPRGDLDVVVEGDAAAFAARLGGEARAHERFGTFAVRVDGLRVDVATARAETYPRPGALPEVRPASLREDLARRDFTINAMAIPLAGEPELVDPHGGREDLGAGLLRLLHANSIADDPTRALRAARYAARFGFALEPASEAQVRAADLATVSADRVEAELRKLAAEERARAGFELLAAWGLVELAPDGAALVDAVAKLSARDPWREVDHAEAVLASALGRGLAEAAELAAYRPPSPSAGRERAAGRSPVTLLLARAMGAAWLDDYMRSWRHVGLDIGGGDLLAAGIEEGPAIGRGLAAALRAKLDGEISGREEELRVALAAAREGRP